MELHEKQLLLLLKNSFLDCLDMNKLVDLYETTHNMLSTVKKILKVEEITYLRFDDWKEQLNFFASSNPNTAIQLTDVKIPYTELLAIKKDIYKTTTLFPELKEYDLLVKLNNDQEIFGLLLMKIGEESHLHYCTEELLFTIRQECLLFIEKALNIRKIILEEKRYKQLYRVTEKFHSSMNVDGVLGEIILSLQEVYPTFTYYLLLSHDNNCHENLPIKDLEYDSENMAAMQAYVNGTIQFEDSIIEKRSVLYAPLKGKQGVYGVLQVISPDTLVFPKNEVKFITLLANTAGTALENAQLYQQSKRLISDLRLINETSHRLNSNLRLNETISFMGEQICRSFYAEEVGFVMLSENGENLILTGSTSFFETKEATLYVQYIKEKILQEHESVFIGDLHIPVEIVDSHQYRSVMAVPMIQSNVIKGMAIVLHKESYKFSFETFKLLQSLIHHSTLAFTNSMLREELEKLVVTDHLTKLYSRNYLDDRIQRSMRDDDKGTFILIDIDNFKSINDTYGHQVGDDVIIQVANLIKANIRGSDVGARWGGEELAIYLPKVSLEVGITIAERLVVKVAKNSCPSVTISCGISFWQCEHSDTVKSLFLRADKAMYKAKNNGKNRVIVYEADANTD